MLSNAAFTCGGSLNGLRPFCSMSFVAASAISYASWIFPSLQSVITSRRQIAFVSRICFS